MKKTITVILIAAALAGCTPNEEAKPGNPTSGFKEYDVNLTDGRSVPCLQYGGHRGGISCDWEASK